MEYQTKAKLFSMKYYREEPDYIKAQMGQEEVWDAIYKPGNAM